MSRYVIRYDPEGAAANAGKNCEDCGHPADEHIVVAAGDGPVTNGTIFCPKPDCDCIGEWRVDMTMC